jgi:hypothetical protein
MINVLGLEQEDKDVINESFNLLSKKYNCVIDNDLVEAFTNKLSETQLLNTYSTITIKNVFKISLAKGSFYIISIYLASFKDRIEPRVMIYGLSMLDKDMGTVLIRPENLLDKIGGIFNKKENDFIEHKGFRNKYCLFAKDKTALKENLNAAFFDEVYKMDKLYLEFYDKMLLTGFNKKSKTEDVMLLAGFMEQLKGIGF